MNKEVAIRQLNSALEACEEVGIKFYAAVLYPDRDQILKVPEDLHFNGKYFSLNGHSQEPCPT